MESPFTSIDTLRKNIIQFVEANSFENTVKQSLTIKDFSGIAQYMDTSILFVIDYQDKTLQKYTPSCSVIEVINNIVSNVEYIDYKFYKVVSKKNANSILYILSIKALYKGSETDIGMLFIMEDSIITSVKLY